MSGIHKNRSVRLMASVAASALLLGASAAWAEAKPIVIQAQSLATALHEFASQTGRPIMFSPSATASKATAGVSGVADQQLALAQLLEGTGLTYRAEGDAFVIVSASDPQSGSAAGDGADNGTVQALIVTAQKREENIQDVPIAMSAFTQEDLTKSQVAAGPDLMTQVPNMTFTKTNFSGYSIQIRGIGTQAISATTDPAVAVAFNNTPFLSNHFFEQEFYDLERIEVLRGPQGTLYGRNATAGVVNVISAKPKSHFEAKLSGDLSNYNSSRFEGMVNIPLVEDKAALRIAGAWTKRDGFVKNILTGQQTDGRDLWSARVTLGLTPTDKFTANLIYERFQENDDRLRSGKQLCRTDPSPGVINGYVLQNDGSGLDAYSVGRFSQGCLPASLYSPDSFQTPNGYALTYYGAAANLGAPVDPHLNPYASSVQSRNLREIETHIVPEYDAAADVVELQLSYDLSDKLKITSETGYSRDWTFSFEDYNRFDTTPGVFPISLARDPDHPVTDANGVFCDPQLGCTNRLAAGDLATARARQFSQEFRLASDFAGPVNFSVGANFLRYDTEVKYYVFINSLSAWAASSGPSWIPGVTDNGWRLDNSRGYVWSDPNQLYNLTGSAYMDPNNIHNLNDQGRNYFLSKNPYHLLSYAAFGEAYWQVADNLKVTAGLRWTVDRKTAPQIPSWLLAGGSYGTATRRVINQEWKEPTGRLAIDWKPHLSFTDETLLYASYVRGYKAGGANPPPPVVEASLVSCSSCNYDPNALVLESLTHPATFGPEFVNAYEVGTKNTLLDGKLTFNLNAFYYDYMGYQISEIVDRSALNLNYDAKIWGSELEIDWRPLENLHLGFKGGYENTRLADGSKAIDLMDRTAGDPRYLLKRPFPTEPSNCIVPIEHAFDNDFACEAYRIGQSLWYAPNNGEGIYKDLSGNQLPNAPKFTATITADYTVPLPNNWLATLHTDLYYQAEAWTRIFNTPGYDKLKAYNNINLAAIFTNEDAGWTIMAYVKNLQNKDNITGAFLNSDDSGLTTNVFLNEPRLYGLRVTKNWTGDNPFGDLFGQHKAGEPYPFQLELYGDYSRFGQGHEHYAPPIATMFNSTFPAHDDAQSDLDWGSGGGARFTYTPSGKSWNVSGSVRYGRAKGQTEAHAQQALEGYQCLVVPGYFKRCANRSTGQGYVDQYQAGYDDSSGVDPTLAGYFNTYDAPVHNQESHANVDFMVGKDFGIGIRAGRRISAEFSGGLAYARLKSSTDVALHARPDTEFFDIIVGEPFPYNHVHLLSANMQARREFEGAGPAFEWRASAALAGAPESAGQVALDASLGGAMLFGKQQTRVHEHRAGRYIGQRFFVLGGENNAIELTPPYDTTLDHVRSKRVTVPAVNASVGLSYAVGGVKVGAGYHIERYFDAIDAGIETRKVFDRQYDGPYFKVSVGFGG